MIFPTHLEASILLRKSFELKVAENPTSDDWFNSCIKNYMLEQDKLNQLYDQHLVLWMFVAVGEDGGVLTKPYEGMFEVEGRKATGCTLLNPDEAKIHGNPRYYHKGKYLKAVKEYEAAQNRVLFEGWELIEHGFDMMDLIYTVECADINIRIYFSGKQAEKFEVANLDDNTIITVECSMDRVINLVPNLTPTQSAITTLNLKI